MEDYMIAGTCPLCGKPVIKTCKGFRCQGNFQQENPCQFSLLPIVCNRRLSDAEVSSLLARETLLLDGMATKEGKSFTSAVSMGDDGKLVVDSKISRCPKCGYPVYVGAKAFSCGNHADEANRCPFVIWRNYGGYDVTLDDVKAICENGVTPDEKTMFHDDGKPYTKRLALTPEKDKIVRI